MLLVRRPLSYFGDMLSWLLEEARLLREVTCGCDVHALSVVRKWDSFIRDLFGSREQANRTVTFATVQGFATSSGLSMKYLLFPQNRIESFVELVCSRTDSLSQLIAPKPGE